MDRSEIAMAKHYQRRSTRAMFISGMEMITVIQNNPIPMKSFLNEIRAKRDVKIFLKNPLILLNVYDADVNNIIDIMIK
ncbi:hypothetical protein BLA29_015103, partial [Euroglyphus maynei]